jgi:hypothetical protein
MINNINISLKNILEIAEKYPFYCVFGLNSFIPIFEIKFMHYFIAQTFYSRIPPRLSKNNVSL